MRLLRDGLGKLSHRPATWVTFVLLAGLMVLIFVAIGSTATNIPTTTQDGQGGQAAAAMRALLTFPGAYDSVFSFITGFGGLLAVVYGAAIAGSEWTWGTLKNAVARGESRSTYVGATFAAMVIMVAVGVVLAAGVGIGSAFLGASLGGIPTDGVGDAAALADLPVKLARACIAVSGTGAIGFAIASFTRSQLAGIGAGIGIYFGGQFSAIFFPDIVRWLPFSAAGAVIESPTRGFGGGFGGGASLAPETAVLVVLGWLVAALIASVLITERAEISG